VIISAKLVKDLRNPSVSPDTNALYGAPSLPAYPDLERTRLEREESRDGEENVQQQRNHLKMTYEPCPIMVTTGFRTGVVTGGLSKCSRVKKHSK
jgi:hypothetical protein